jgi:Ner family transcriptional regulator
MYQSNGTKKSAPEDWHRADIIAALKKAGWSLRRLATYHGYASPTTLGHALSRPWPKGERIVAEAIGADPADIWPSRYQKRIAPSRHAGDHADMRAKSSIHESASVEAGVS